MADERIINTEILANSPPNFIYKWMKKNYHNIPNIIVDDLESKLSLRSDPIIKIALARFAYDETIVKSLYESKDKVLMIAALMNKNSAWLTEDYIKQIILNNNKNELYALFTNDNVFGRDRTNEAFLIKLYKREEIFKEITDDQWCELITYTSENNLIKERREHPLEALDNNDELFEAIWKLPGYAPINDKWMFALNHLLSKAALPYTIAFHMNEKDIIEMIKRWGIDDKFPNYVSDLSYSNLRSSIARLYRAQSSEKFLELVNSNDAALRRTFYRYSTHPRVDKMKLYFEKDKEDFVSAAVNNIHYYTDKNIRETLRLQLFSLNIDIAFLHTLSSIYGMMLERCKAESPELFTDESDEISSSADLTDSESEPQSAQSNHNEILSKMSQLNEKVSAIFLLLLIGLIILYFK